MAITTFSGVQQVWNNGSLKDLTFDNLGDLATVGILNTDAATTAVFDNSLLTGTDDTVNVELDGAEAPGGDISIERDGSDGVENVAVNSGGDAANRRRVRLILIFSSGLTRYP